MKDLFVFHMCDFELVHVNGKSITLRKKNSEDLIYVTNRVFNRINSDPNNICRIVEVDSTTTPRGQFGPHQWIETFSRF